MQYLFFLFLKRTIHNIPWCFSSKNCWAVSFLIHCVVLLRLLSLHRDWSFLLSDQGREFCSPRHSFRTLLDLFLMYFVLLCFYETFLRNVICPTIKQVLWWYFAKICRMRSLDEGKCWERFETKRKWSSRMRYWLHLVIHCIQRNVKRLEIISSLFFNFAI